MTIFLFEIRCNQQPPWRNRLARSAVNRKVGGSSPPGGVFFFFCFLSCFIHAIIVINVEKNIFHSSQF